MPLQAARDTVLDHTPFLQKVVGETSPAEILARLAAIDQAELAFAAVAGPRPQ